MVHWTILIANPSFKILLVVGNSRTSKPIILPHSNAAVRLRISTAHKAVDFRALALLFSEQYDDNEMNLKASSFRHIVSGILTSLIISVINRPYNSKKLVISIRWALIFKDETLSYNKFELWIAPAAWLREICTWIGRTIIRHTWTKTYFKLFKLS